MGRVMKKGKIPFLIAILLLSLLMVGMDFANDVRVGRYETTADTAKDNQVHPLQQVFQLQIPSTVNTVGGAMTYILSNTGYRLPSKNQQSTATQVLLSQPLPLTNRHLGPITVLNALHALAGSSYQVVVDPVNRLISFVLQPQVQPLY